MSSWPCSLINQVQSWINSWKLCCTKRSSLGAVGCQGSHSNGVFWSHLATSLWENKSQIRACFWVLKGGGGGGVFRRCSQHRLSILQQELKLNSVAVTSGLMCWLMLVSLVRLLAFSTTMIVTLVSLVKIFKCSHIHRGHTDMFASNLGSPTLISKQFTKPDNLSLASVPIEALRQISPFFCQEGWLRVKWTRYSCSLSLA